MHDENKIVRERQRLIRRQMSSRGIAIKAVAYDAGWETTSTVQSYFPADTDKEPAIMSIAALYRLVEARALPLDLLSLLLPDGYQIVRAPEDIDHDALCKLACDYVSTKNAAHHPDSEAGVAIGEGEDASLTAIIVELKAAA